MAFMMPWIAFCLWGFSILVFYPRGDGDQNARALAIQRRTGGTGRQL